MNARPIAMIAMLVAPVLYSTAAAQDKKIQQSDLPPAVQKALAANTKGATIKGFSQETEDGKTMYEVETTVNGRTRDLLLDASGALVEAEEEVTMASLPAPVQAGLAKAAGAGKITKVEALSKKGKLTGYEAAVSTNGKNSEIKVSPTGKAMKAAKEGKEEEDEEDDKPAGAKKPAMAPARKS